MRRTCVLTLCVLACSFYGARADYEDYYFWNKFKHPYQTYYLEDYCEEAKEVECTSHSHTIHLEKGGSGSGLVVRGFRESSLRKLDTFKSIKCCVNIRSPAKSRMEVQLDDLFIAQRIHNASHCGNFLEVLSTKNSTGPICYTLKDRALESKGEEVVIAYTHEAGQPHPRFQKIKLVVTTITPKSIYGGSCPFQNDLYTCDNSNCIWRGFACDARNNCGDWSDEFYCGFFSRNLGIFAGILAGTVLILLICCCYCCCCKRKKQTMKEFKQVHTLTDSGGVVYSMPPLAVPYQSTQGDGNPNLLSPPPYAQALNDKATMYPSLHAARNYGSNASAPPLTIK